MHKALLCIAVDLIPTANKKQPAMYTQFRILHQPFVNVLCLQLHFLIGLPPSLLGFSSSHVAPMEAFPLPIRHISSRLHYTCSIIRFHALPISYTLCPISRSCITSSSSFHTLTPCTLFCCTSSSYSSLASSRRYTCS